MIELVNFLIKELVDDKDNVSVKEEGETLIVSVSKEDMGKVIGKQGRIAKAIRTIVKAASPRDKKYTVEIIEAE